MKKFMAGAAVLVLLLAALVGVLIWRAETFGANPGATTKVVLPEPPSVDVAAAAASLGEAIRIRTVSEAAGDPKPGADQAWVELESMLLQRYPLVFAAGVERVADHTLLVTWTGSDASLPPLILMAHQDVVPINPGTEADWTHGPFGGVVADGYVWGRGAMDDKGSVIAILEAAESLAKSGWTPKRTIMLLFSHDEEVSGRGAREVHR